MSRGLGQRRGFSPFSFKKAMTLVGVLWIILSLLYLCLSLRAQSNPALN